jgi:hypothetical protein
MRLWERVRARLSEEHRAQPAARPRERGGALRDLRTLPDRVRPITPAGLHAAFLRAAVPG